MPLLSRSVDCVKELSVSNSMPQLGGKYPIGSTRPYRAIALSRCSHSWIRTLDWRLPSWLAPGTLTAVTRSSRGHLVRCHLDTECFTPCRRAGRGFVRPLRELSCVMQLSLAEALADIVVYPSPQETRNRLRGGTTRGMRCSEHFLSRYPQAIPSSKHTSHSGHLRSRGSQQVQ